MNEVVVKEEVIEETCNFTFKNGEYVEVKQEEVEQKPEHLLEKDIKTETNDDFFENNNSDEFSEDIKPEQRESDSKIENKMSKEACTFQCTICQKRCPRSSLKLITTFEDRTVLSEIFKVEGLVKTNPNFVCYSHIQTIINDNAGKLKLANAPSGKLLRSFITKNKKFIKERESRRRVCQVCHMNKPYCHIYEVSSIHIRVVLMTGCILRGTHSIDEAMNYITNNNGYTCYSHCKETIDKIFERLGVRNKLEFWNCPRLAMSDLVDIAKNFDSKFTVDQFVLAFSTLYMKKPKNVPSNL
ncbi:hypothetical protein B9Z55_021061 [Caenorhabditis nigoni]|uniref:4Fe-4S ferredoxin-type domain-containing protein n=1 Tax=Caenorhabditis nigoni TaxID=1611254 RepID=A0A2G5TQC5_9PELO|nr:hypothetical protein B9Z55_021061 [Caenorhabditis nigoni]